MTNEERVIALRTEIDEITALLEDRAVQLAGSARYKGKSYTLSQLVKLKNEKEKTRNEFAVKASEEREKEQEEIVARGYKLPTLEKQYKKAFEMLDAVIKRNGNIEKAQEELLAADQALREFDPQNKLLPQVETQTRPEPTSTAKTAPRLGDQSAAPNAAAAAAMKKDMAEPKPIKTEPKIVNGKAVVVQTLPNGTVVVQEDTTTPSPSAGGVSGGIAGAGKKTKGVGITSTAWESKFREIAPSKAWLLDLDRSKYPGLFAFLQKSVVENYDDERFATELEGTDYYRELALSGKAREIKSIVGDLGFDSTDFSKFLTDAVNQGWEGDRLKQKTYEEVFRRNPDGAFANPTALARARKSNDYLNVQLIATNYFNKPSESSIEAVLTGRIMTEDFQRQQREIAKAKYSHLAPLIDQGVTLEDLATNFKQSAARLLELDPAAIDMSAAEYEVALNFGEEGKRRVMTTGEWERLLRTDQRYGWEKTENAKAEARSLATNIAQAFGRII